jgi:hypothetical protein
LRREVYERVASRWQQYGFSGTAPRLEVFHDEG